MKPTHRPFRLFARTPTGLCLALLGGIVMTTPAQPAVAPTRGEMLARDRWLKEHVLGAQPPFSFTYDGKPSAALLSGWHRKSATRRLSDGRTERTLTWTDPSTGLAVRRVAVEYADFPAAEWTVSLKNAGQARTPLLEAIQGIDAEVLPAAKGEVTLRHWRGDLCTPDSYQPFVEALTPGAGKRFAPSGGRPTQGGFPYFSLQASHGGVCAAIGWPGQWAASLDRAQDGATRLVAGQELTHLRLDPGEEIRIPLVALLFWDGRDPVRAQNLWRRWMLAHNVPKPDGAPPKPMYVFCSGGFFPGLKVSEASEKQFIDALGQKGVKIDYWWMDAGWYPCPEWPQVGTWEPDPERFPRGIRGVSDYVHDRGMKLVVWFEPERVSGGSWIADNHPEWVFGGKGGGLLNLGNPEARRWLTDHVDRLLTEQGIDLYRQDFNIDPLPFWRGSDAPDRQGMAENLHVQGYLAYWDELRRRHPNMLIDSCASGGRRNDLETLRRAVPLLRSDYQAFDGNPGFAPGNQCQTYGLSSWVPFYGTGVYYTPKLMTYCARSYTCPAFGICTDVRKEGTDWDLYRRLEAQWREVAGMMLGDYYPLTPYSLTEDAWVAWQFDRPEQGEGMVQAFRRTQCAKAAETVLLRGLDPSARYEVEDVDTPVRRVMTGRELMEGGLSVAIPEQPGAAIILYRKAP